MQKEGNSLPATESRLIQDALVALRERLPPDWVLSAPVGQFRAGPDALFTLTTPDGNTTLIAVEAKSRVEPREANRVAAQLRSLSTGPAMVVSNYLPRRTRELLKASGVGYADSTGNIYLSIPNPPLFLSDRGSDNDPYREGSELRSLKGPKAGRVVRALVDFTPPYAIKELALKAGAIEPTVSRVVTFLEKQVLVERNRAGTVVSVDWEGVLRQWAENYSVLRSNVTSSYLYPRGLNFMGQELQEAAPDFSGLQRLLAEAAHLSAIYDIGQFEYAATGSLAANQIAPYAPPAQAMLYVRNRLAIVEWLKLVPTDRGANIVLLEPFDSVVFDRTKWRGFWAAAPSQAAVDLMGSTGRGPQEAEFLLGWMKENEHVWRS